MVTQTTKPTETPTPQQQNTKHENIQFHNIRNSKSAKVVNFAPRPSERPTPLTGRAHTRKHENTVPCHTLYSRTRSDTKDSKRDHFGTILDPPDRPGRTQKTQKVKKRKKCLKPHPSPLKFQKVPFWHF